MGRAPTDVAGFLPQVAVVPPTMLQGSGMSWVFTEHLLWIRSCARGRRMNGTPP